MASRAGAKGKGNAFERTLEVDLEQAGFPVNRGSSADQGKFKSSDLLVPGGTSGPLACNSGRVRPAFLYEAKNHEKWPWSTWLKAYGQASTAAEAHGGDAIPAVVSHLFNTREHYVLVRWDHWLRVKKDAYP